ncbi:MAG: FGGY family carbohydrate kinase, partial [Pseudomonas sp.]
DYCAELKAAGHEAAVAAKTGLLIDPYFSATKLRWILETVPGARARAERGELRFGTVDSFLLWRLTGGRSHKTDATNASRTLLFNIHSQQWDEELLALFEIPPSLLPEVLDCAADFGSTEAELLGASIPVLGMAGDQQAALIGQACFEAGMVKSTYGTGCFMIQNTGATPVTSQNRLLTTVGYRLNGRVTYAVEGSIFVAGAAVQWLRDGIKLISHARDSEALAEQTGDACGVYLVPAFTGLGAPYWDPKARGAIFGLTRDTGIKEIVTAGLQSVCYQTRDLLEAMRQDGANPPSALRVDGGMVVNNWVMQFLADILGVPVERPRVTETTALGVAYLAGLQAGFYRDLDEIAGHWRRVQRVSPRMAEAHRGKLYAGWLDAVQRVRSES